MSLSEGPRFFDLYLELRQSRPALQPPHKGATIFGSFVFCMMDQGPHTGASKTTSGCRAARWPVRTLVVAQVRYLLGQVQGSSSEPELFR